MKDLHQAVRRGDLATMRILLDEDRSLANARSESDPRGTFALHVAAEHGQAAAARLLLEYGAKVALQGRWQRFSNATAEDWQKTADLIKARGGIE